MFPTKSLKSRIQVFNYLLNEFAFGNCVKLIYFPGKPLHLTPLIKKGKIKQAQELAIVDTEFFGNEVSDVESYSGYLTVDTVDPNCDSNLFFWYFAAEVCNDMDNYLHRSLSKHLILITS